MANGNPQDMADKYSKRASQKYKNALKYFGGLMFLFLSTLAAVVFADEVAKLTIDIAGKSASAIIKEREVQLWQGHNYYDIAIVRDGQTAAVTGDPGLIMISDDDRRSWVKAPSNTKRSIYGIALSDNGKTAVAVGMQGLVRFSSDGGETWINRGDLGAEDINGVALSGDGMTAVAVGNEGLVRISRNGGKDWETHDFAKRPDDFMARHINGVAMSKSVEVVILVGEDNFVMVSTDGGVKWNTRDGTHEEHDNFRATDFRDVAVSADGKTAIAVGERGLVSRSDDGGESWDPVQSAAGVRLNAVTLSDNGDVAVAVGNDGTVLVSTDGGENWNVRDSKTSNDLNAVALEKGDTEALIVGDRTTILRLTPSEQKDLFEIVSVGRLSISRYLSEEEEEKIENLEEEERQIAYDATKDKVLIYSTGLRIGAILVFLLWVRQMANLMHYNLRLAAYYDARADAIRLFRSGELSQPDEKGELSQSKKIHLLKRLMRTVTPDDIDIGRSPRGMIEWAMRLARGMLRREAKD